MFVLPLRDASPKTRIAFVNYSIIIANVIIFLYTYPFSFSPSSVSEYIRILKNYGVVPDNLRFHTLITSTFLHGDVFHIGFNMLFLWIFGDNIEDSLGHIRYLFFYVIAGIVASLPHVILNPNSSTPMIGASGAISGVLGAYAVLHSRSKVTTLVIFPYVFGIRLFSIPAVWFLGIWFALQILGGSVRLSETEIEGGVAYSAHISGFIFGITISLLALATHITKRYSKFEREMEERISRRVEDAFSKREPDVMRQPVDKIVFLLGANQYAAAVASYLDLIRDSKHCFLPPDSQLAIGDEFFKLGNYDAAEEAYVRFLHTYRAHKLAPRAKYNLALIAVQKKDYAKARTFLLQLLIEETDTGRIAEVKRELAKLEHNSRRS